ncbi:hypothetical protein JCM19000A_26610 [Silvimonas sp. JCM 19000]
MKTTSIHLLGVAALACSLLAHAETGTVIRASELKQKPFLDASSTGQVSPGNSVSIVSRQGAWMQVKANGQSGWIKLLNVRTGSASAGSGGNSLGTLAKVLTTGSSGTTVTTGVKGLTSGEVTATHPDPAQLQKLDDYASSTSQAATAARKVPLKPRQVDDIATRASNRSN